MLQIEFQHLYTGVDLCGEGMIGIGIVLVGDVEWFG